MLCILDAAPTLAPNVGADGCLLVVFEVAREVDAARPRPMVFFTPLLTGRDVAGAASFRLGTSPARSARVGRLVMGSGTERVNGLPDTLCMETGILQPDILCFVAAACCDMLRAFIPDSFNSPRARVVEVKGLNVVGCLRPVGFALLCSVDFN